MGVIQTKRMKGREGKILRPKCKRYVRRFVPGMLLTFRSYRSIRVHQSTNICGETRDLFRDVIRREKSRHACPKTSSRFGTSSRTCCILNKDNAWTHHPAVGFSCKSRGSFTCRSLPCCLVLAHSGDRTGTLSCEATAVVILRRQEPVCTIPVRV